MLRKNVLIHLVLLCLTLSLSSCADIIENVFFNKDGSGTYTIKVDMSNGNVAGVMRVMMNDQKPDNPFNLFKAAFDESRSPLMNIEGITGLRARLDDKNVVLTAEIDFDNVNALNKAMNKMYPGAKSSPYEKDLVFFDVDRKAYSRSGINVISIAIEKQAAASKGNSEAMFSPEVIFGDMTFETIMTFEKGIRSFDNKDFSKTDKSVSRKYYPYKKHLGNPNLAITVKAK